MASWFIYYLPFFSLKKTNFFLKSWNGLLLFVYKFDADLIIIQHFETGNFGIRIWAINMTLYEVFVVSDNSTAFKQSWSVSSFEFLLTPSNYTIPFYFGIMKLVGFQNLSIFLINLFMDFDTFTVSVWLIVLLCNFDETTGIKHFSYLNLLFQFLRIVPYFDSYLTIFLPYNTKYWIFIDKIERIIIEINRKRHSFDLKQDCEQYLTAVMDDVFDLTMAASIRFIKIIAVTQFQRTSSR